MNPVASALRYSPEGGEERVSVHLRTGSAEVRVEDPGIGITPDDLPHTGQPFILTARARQIAGGAGLGLYLSRQIVAVHQGRLVIDSAPDGRITVNVWLPPEADGAGPAELA